MSDDGDIPYFMSGEDTGFPTTLGSRNYSVHTEPDDQGPRYDHSISRCALFVAAVHLGYLGEAQAQRLRVNLPHVESFFLRATFSVIATDNPDQQPVIGFNDGAFALMPAPGLGVFGTGKFASLQLASWNPAIANWSYLGNPTAENLWTVDGLHTLNLAFNKGAVRVYIDQKLVLAGSVSVSHMDNVDFGNLSIDGTWWSQIAAANFDLLNTLLITLPPTGLGTVSEWDGDLSGVNKVTIDDSTAMTTHAAEKQQYTVALSAHAAQLVLMAVAVEQRLGVVWNNVVKVPDGYAFNMRANDGTEVTITGPDATKLLSSVPQIYPVNPITGKKWQAADIGVGFEVGVASTVSTP